jgi:hypothetical protein
MSISKEPIDLRATVQARLDRIIFITLLQLKDVSTSACSALGEGTSADYSQGIRLNESVGIFLNYWGWARPHKRYSFAVFEQLDRRWSQVASRIEDIDEAITYAIRTLVEHALRSAKAVP